MLAHQPIDTIRIERYKALADLSLQGCGRVTVIGGRNNVGKTSILEALFVFIDRNNPKAMLRPFSWRGLAGWAARRDEFFDAVFTGFKREKPIKIEFRRGANLESLELAVAASGTVPPKPSPMGDQIEEASTLAEATPAFGLQVSYRGLDGTKLQNTVLVPQIEWQFPTGLGPTTGVVYLGIRSLSPDEDPDRFAYLDVHNRTHEAVEFLQIFVPELRQISAVQLGDKVLLWADVGLPRKVPVALLGEGTSRLLSMFLAITAARDGVALLDEIGIGVHHSMLERMWSALHDAAVRNNSQIFATSHSQEVLDAAPAAMRSVSDPDLVYFRIERVDDSLQAVRYSTAEMAAAASNHWEVR